MMHDELNPTDSVTEHHAANESTPASECGSNHMKREVRAVLNDHSRCYDEHLAPRKEAQHRVYIAGSSKHTDHARRLAALLGCHGIQPTERWWDVIDADRAVGVADGDLGPTAARRCAEADLAGIDAADVLVLIPLPKSHGAMLETGFALAKGKPVIQLGPAGHIWEHLPGVTVAQVEHLQAWPVSPYAADYLGQELAQLIRDLLEEQPALTSILDDPRMDGERWIDANDVTWEMLHAWPVWENEERLERAARKLWSGEAKVIGGRWRPLRLPGMNERGEVAAHNMTATHFERVCGWQFKSPHTENVWLTQRDDGCTMRFVELDIGEVWRPAIWAQLDEKPVVIRPVEKEPPPNRKELGAELRKRREERGISPASAANGAGMANASQWLAVEEGRVALDAEQRGLCWRSLELNRDDAGMCHADWSRWFERLAVEYSHPRQYQGEELSGLVEEMIAAGYGPRPAIAMLAESVIERAARKDAKNMAGDVKLLSGLQHAMARIGNGESWLAQHLVKRAIEDGEVCIDEAERGPLDPDPLVLGGQFYASEIHAMANEAERLHVAGSGLRALRCLATHGIGEVARRLGWRASRVSEIERATMEPATTGELVALMRCLADMLEASDGDE